MSIEQRQWERIEGIVTRIDAKVRERYGDWAGAFAAARAGDDDAVRLVAYMGQAAEAIDGLMVDWPSSSAVN